MTAEELESGASHEKGK
jgi:hypothetical protein